MAFSTTGAVSGATAGAAFGPIGAGIGGLIGGFLGGGDDDGDRAQAFSREQVELGIKGIEQQLGTTQGQLDPFIQAGTGAIPGVTQGTSVGGISSRLQEIFSNESFRPLFEERERAVRGQLAAGGLTRSGTAVNEIANVPTQLGFGIEQLLQDRLTGVAGTGLSAVGQSGQLGANAASNVANLRAGVGANAASAFLFDQSTQAQGTQNLAELFGDIDFKQLFSGGGGGGGGGGFTFSDPKLKENIHKIGMIANMNIYEWDWIDKAEGTIIEKCGTIGFMADEVLLAYPHHVQEYCGFQMINYPGLLDELEEIN